MATASDSLPSVGLETSCSAYAVNAPFMVNVLGVLTLDFKGGLKTRVDSNLSSGSGVKLKMLALELSADSPILGKVTITQANIDITPLSLLEVTGASTFRNTFFWDFTVTIEKP